MCVSPTREYVSLLGLCVFVSSILYVRECVNDARVLL